MSKTAITVTGDREVMAKLRRMADTVARKHLEQAVMVGAETVRSEVERRAPVGDRSDWPEGRKRTVRLKDSIVAKTVRRRADGVSVDVGPDYSRNRVGHLVEYGHDLVAGGKKGKGGKVRGWVAPHPFMRPAYEGTKEQAMAEIGEALRRAVLQEAR